MTTLEDRRPVAAETCPNSRGVWLGAILSKLLTEHPDIELASIRLIPNEDGTVGIAGRIGQLAGIECPQCHAPVGRPHTEYCTLAPGKVWDGVLPPHEHVNARDAADCEQCNRPTRPTA